MSVTLDKAPLVSLRKTYNYQWFTSHFGTSSEWTRNRWRDIFADARRGTPQQQHAVAEAEREGHLAFEYTQGYRDAVRYLRDADRELHELLLHDVWTFYREYEWHVFKSHLHCGGSRFGWLPMWDKYLTEKKRLLRVP